MSTQTANAQERCDPTTDHEDRLGPDAPIDQLPDDLPALPEAWEYIPDRTDRPFNARAAWRHCETGQEVWVKNDRKPSQPCIDGTGGEDTGFIAEVSAAGNARGMRAISSELASKDGAYEVAIRFMATYPAGDYEISELDYGIGPAEW